jgi:hypothetical protein
VHDLIVGSDEARLDRGLRLGAAFKNSAGDQQAVSALARAAHAPNSRNNGPYTIVTRIGRNICSGRNDCLFEEEQYGT